MLIDREVDDATLKVHVRTRREEAVGVISLDLASDTDELLPPFEPGALIDVHVSDGVVRPYSLCGDSKRLDRYTLGVLLEPQSRGGSKAIHACFFPGKDLRISRPRINFRVVQNASHSILVAGGIGITPIMSMAWALSARGASFELHYGTRSVERTAFHRDVFQTDEEKSSNRSVTLCCSRAKSSTLVLDL